jgi:tetratricopeptide (TPR) repeat protein
MPQPKEAAYELIEHLNDLVLRGERDELAIHRVKREAERLKNTDPASAYLLLGMVACLERDLSSSRKYHQKALNARNDFVTNINFALSLARLGAISEATPYFERAVKIQPENITALEMLIDNVLTACRFRCTRDLLRKWKSLNPDKEHRLEKDIVNYVSILEGNKVSDEEAETLLKLASDQMLANSLYPSFTNPVAEIEIFEEDSIKWVDYSINIQGKVDDVVEMNCRLADVVAENVAPKVLKSIVIRYAVHGN